MEVDVYIVDKENLVNDIDIVKNFFYHFIPTYQLRQEILETMPNR